MNMNNNHSDIRDTQECRESLRKTFHLYLRDDLPPDAKKRILEFVDLIIAISKGEFVCNDCLQKSALRGFEGIIL